LYNGDRSGDLGRILAPPFDVVSRQLQAELYARSPYNVVRLELADAPADPGVPGNRYAAAAAALAEWLSQGVLFRPERPALYVCEHTFAAGGRRRRRTGLYAAVRLGPLGEHVLPHEGTLRGPKADRLALMGAAGASFSPVMALYRDEDGRVRQALDRRDRELASAAGGDEEYRLWSVEDESAIDAICRGLGDGPLYIADGHHRYETALAYQDRRLAAEPDAPADAPFRFAFMLLVSAADDGLLILPTHRVVGPLAAEERQRLEHELDRADVAPAPTTDVVELMSRLNQDKGPDHLYGMYRRKSLSLLRLPRDPEAETSPVAGLDVTALHRRLLDPALGGPGGRADMPAPGSAWDQEVSHDSGDRAGRLRYVVDEREAVRLVDEGHAEVAVFLRPTRVEQVIAAAQAGQRMPGKSTYFYPKAPAGLVMYPLR
jgi:uncharacterized protein (DUF1015 family)